MIILPYLLLLLFLICFCLDVRKAILLSLVIRPVTDCFYETKYAFAGLKPTEYLGFLLPTLIFLRILVSREHGFLRAPLGWLWMTYLFVQLFGTVLIMTVGNDLLLGANYFFRAFNGFIGFFLFQEFFRERAQFKALLLALLVAGIVPLAMSVYQNILGGVIKTEETLGGLVRNIGFYHDAYTLRLYCFQSIAAALLYWTYFLKGIRPFSRSVLLVMGGVATFTVFRLYSKAGYLVLLSWLLIWCIARRRYLMLGAAVAILAIVVVVAGPQKLDTINTVYSKEVSALQGKGKTDLMFQGRVMGWREAWREFTHYPLVLQLIGDGSPHTGAHNDYLRALLGTGIIGLSFYLALLATHAARTVSACWRRSTPLNTIAMMLVVMWLIDAMGLVPGAYPGYQIFVWGFVGLSLRGVDALDQSLPVPVEHDLAEADNAAVIAA